MNSGLRRPDFVDALLPTMVALLVYRLGLHIPIPGLEPNALPHLAHGGGSTFYIPGGVTARTSIFALAINPLFGALILIELVKVLAPRLRGWQRATPGNAAKLGRIILSLALISAFLQANGIVTGLEDITGLVTDPGLLFRLSTTATLMAGTTLVSWLAWQITSRGLGSGLWLIIVAPTLAGLLPTIAKLYELQTQGLVPGAAVLWGAVFIVAAVAAVVGVLSAGGRTADTAPACVWSTVLAYTTLPWLVLPVSALAHLFLSGNSFQWLEQGHPVRLAALALLLWLFLGLYARSCRLAGAAVAALPAAVLAAVLAAVALGCEALPTYLGVPVILLGQPLLLLAIVMTTVLQDWRPYAPASHEGAQSSAANR